MIFNFEANICYKSLRGGTTEVWSLVYGIPQILAAYAGNMLSRISGGYSPPDVVGMTKWNAATKERKTTQLGIGLPING